MSTRAFRRVAKALGRWCEDIHAKQPDECVTVYFNGREEDFEWRLYRGAY